MPVRSRLLRACLAVAALATFAASPPGHAESAWPRPWYGIVAPKGTPAQIVDKLNASINRQLLDPAFRDKLAATGAEPRGGSVADFRAMVDAKIPRTEKLVRQSGLTLQ